MTTTNPHPLLDSLGGLLAPIEASSPAGNEAKDDERYELVRSELQKLSGPASTTPDWNGVVRSGHALLTERTKDLSIACDVAIAMFASGGLTEGTRGLLLVAGLLLRFEGLHPARPRARNGAVQTLIERVPVRLAHVQPTRESVDALNEAIRLLDEGITARLGAEGPSTRPLREASQRLAQRCPAPPPPPPLPKPIEPATPPAMEVPPILAPAPPLAPHAPPPVAAPSPAPLPDVTTMPLATRLQTLGDALTQTALSMRQGEALPAGFMRLFLSGLYLPLMDAPPTKLALPAPKPFLEGARALHERGDHLGCVQHIIQGLARARFALDAHRTLWLSLEAIGASTASARDELEVEMRGLVKRHPSLLETTFRDGAPLMNEETSKWLKSSRAAAKMTAVISPAPTPSEQDDTLSRASALAASGAFAEAMQVLEVSAACASTGLLRFTRELALAELSESLPESVIAETLFASLHAEASEGSLRMWEPKLYARAAQGLYRVLAVKSDAASKERAQQVFQVLVRTSPSHAVEALAGAQR
jgi:type VI secretion system ImpA/VasJ family protein